MVEITKPVTLSNGQSAVIRKLTWKQVKEAGKEQFKEGVAQMKEFGAELVKAFREGQSAEDVADKVEAIERRRKTSPNTYDMGITLTYGLISIDGAPVSEEVVERLTADVADALHSAIVAFAFETVEKNG